MSAFKTYWGETHHNTFVPPQPEPDFRHILEQVSGYLDFYAAAYYPMVFPVPEILPEAGLDHSYKGTHAEDWKAEDRIAEEWAQVNELTAEFNGDKEFITFPGFEWHGSGRYGDHNVIYKTEGEDVPRVDSLMELYTALKDKDALAIPHHTAYMTGHRAPVWSYCNTDISPFAEIFSVHGCSETDEDWMGGMRNNTHMGPGVAGSTYKDALDAGLRLGAICFSDSFGDHIPWGAGLMAVLAERLDRQSLWDAFKARRVYGVTGDRILLDMTVNGEPMGSEVPYTDERQISVSVEGWDALDRVEVLRNNKVIFTHDHQDTWRIPPSAVRGRFKLRIETGWGPRETEFPMPRSPFDCSLKVVGSRFLGYMPAWMDMEQTPPKIAVDGARYAMNSGTVGPFQSANVFEIETVTDGDMEIVINGERLAGKVAEFCRQGRMIYFRDEAVGLMQQYTGVTPDDISREDPFFHMARKAKIHKMIPEAGFRVGFEVTDDDDLKDDVHYRVRVEQRNGQRAWSSPVWVSKKEVRS